MKKRLRAEIYSAYIEMGQKGMPVDPMLYTIVQTKLLDDKLCGTHAKRTPPLPPVSSAAPHRRSVNASKEKRQRSCSIFEIVEILAEEPASKTTWHRFLVRWKGYDPSWEQWRIPGRGQVGAPIETWEPATSLRQTEALARWKRQHA